MDAGGKRTVPALDRERILDVPTSAAPHMITLHAAFFDRSLDAHLRACRYIAGDGYSWVDGLAAPLIGTARVFDLDLSTLSGLARWSGEVLDRPAVRRGLTPPVTREAEAGASA